MKSSTKVASTRWSVRFNELKEFVKDFGHADVPQHFAKNRSLGSWVNVQRNQYRLRKGGKKSSITEERIQLLESVGFKWKTKRSYRTEFTMNTPWSVRFEELKEFVKRNGHANLPTKYPTNASLPRWAENQRQQYRRRQEGKQSSMTDERIKLLESIGFQWKRQPMQSQKRQKRKIQASNTASTPVSAQGCLPHEDSPLPPVFWREYQATQLNTLGEDGWELISITSVNFKSGATDNIAMVFKRPVGD